MNLFITAETANIPILVGITGHRDIQDEQGLTEHIKKILLDICKKYEASPILLLTPLAEGADRAAAKAVIGIKQTNVSRVAYLVVLPMDEEEYLGTFMDEESVSEYNSLKSQAAGCYKVPIRKSLDIDSIVSTEERHSKLYANIGTYMALNTQILIAAWNGAEEPDQIAIKNGGTYYTLRARLLGFYDDEYGYGENCLANREFGPVYWIKTMRKSSAYLAEGTPVVGPLYPDYPIAGYLYEEILARLDGYNGDISKMRLQSADSIDLSYRRFVTHTYTENSEQKSEVFSFDQSENLLINRYSAADALSSHYQIKRRWDIIFLIVLAFSALLIFELYSGPLAKSWLMILYSAIYLLGSFYYLFRIKAGKHHEKYIQYRGIAEGLRVQFFWHLSGIGARVSDKYLTKQKGPNDWIRIALNNALLLCNANAGQSQQCQQFQNDDTSYLDGIFTAHKLWMLNQYDYYSRAWPKKEKKAYLQKKAEAVLFAIGLLLAVVIVCLDAYRSAAVGIHSWIVFAVGFLPVVIASYKVFAELFAFSRLARKYKWMMMTYSIALHEFERIKNSYGHDPEAFVRKSRKLFYDIGTEALLENDEWIGVFEEKAPEMPK